MQQVPCRARDHKRMVVLAASVLTIFPVGVVLHITVVCNGNFAPSVRKPSVPVFGSKGDTATLSVLTWNVQGGYDLGQFNNGWPARKEPFRAIFSGSPHADVICLQEVTKDQIPFFDDLLAGHASAGTGRDAVTSADEYCPVYFDRRKFELVESGTFWLSDTPDRPSNTWGARYPRICTWAVLKMLGRERDVRVLNTHLALSDQPRRKATALILERLSDVAGPVILAGDFNCGPGNPVWKALARSGYRSADRGGNNTYHLRGIGVACLDALFLTGDLSVTEGAIIREKGGRVYPSDHFGVRATLDLVGD